MRALVVLVTAVLAAASFALPAGAQEAPEPGEEPWQQVVDITFPTDPGAVSFSDSYEACRSGCARVHQAADLIGPKMTPLYAAVDGHVCRIDEGEEDSYGRHLTICGDDGNRYRYLHINNDTPGTDDGMASLEDVYAPGVRAGARVARGQLVAYMGDSGNAESSVNHLHFDLYVPGVTNPWGEERINPYPSLVAALERGDVADGTAVAGEESARLSGPNRVETAVAVSNAAFTRADTVVVATSTAPHAALVGGPLAAVLGGPVLITEPDLLNDAVIDEVRRLGATKMVLVGEVALLDRVVARNLPEVEVEVLDGGDRFATAALVADRVWEATGAHDDEVDGDPVQDVVTDALDVPELDFDDLGPVDGTPTLVFFERGDRTGVVGGLDGAHLPGDLDRLYVSLAGVDPLEVESVTFHRGDRTHPRTRINRERQFPYDLGSADDDGDILGATPWWREAGEQALSAEIDWRDGSETVVTARFEVGSGTDQGRDEGPLPRRAIVALGEHDNPNRAWPDALGASWYGAVRRLPVLLTRTDDLPPATADALDGVDEVVVAGGGAAVSDEQVVLIEALTGDEAQRLRGADRFATAAAIADDLVTRRLVDPTTVYVATGQNWPDAVAAGAAVARAEGLLLLVDGAAGTSLSARTAFTAYAEDISQVVVLGGRAAIADDVERKVASWSL